MTTEKIKPSILPGFMELLPQDQIVFNDMLDTIRETYELFGFVPLDTPVIEKEEILNSKGGDEAEHQMYKFKKGDNDLALRFDLTVPLARYVSQYFNDLQFPFRRYQIGKVYRGEKPQKGRYREFYQCDVDVIGNGELSFFNDAEMVAVISTLFTKLKLGKFVVRINNRKILSGFIQSLLLKDKETDFLRIIDKIDKVGVDSVKVLLSDLGLSAEQVEQSMMLLGYKGAADEVLLNLEKLNIQNDQFSTGLLELKTVVDNINALNVPKDNWIVDLSIARGLAYYTSTVYETFLTEFPELGSVCSGGRYDELAENFSDKKLPGVGVSVGLTRLFSQLLDKGIVRGASFTPSAILVLTMQNTFEAGLSFASYLRENNIKCEVFSNNNLAFKKKLDYANKIGVPFVAIIGEDEASTNRVTIKNMETGEQQLLSKEEILGFIETA